MTRSRGKRTIATYLLSIFLSIVIGILIGFIFREDLYLYLVRPFNNVQGEFDFSILWTAIAGIGTIFLGLVAWLQNRNMHQKNIELQNKQIINENGLKLYNSKQGIKVLKGTECNTSVTDRIGGVSSLIYKKIRNNDELALKLKQWFIVTLKCNNFKPPVQFRVKQVNIYVRDTKTTYFSNTVKSIYPKYIKHCYTNRNPSFCSMIDSIEKNKISFGFELFSVSRKVYFNLDDANAYTIKGIFEVKSNDLVVSEYGFRAVFFADIMKQKLKTSVAYLGGEILDYQNEFDTPQKRKQPKRKKRKRMNYFKRRRWRRWSWRKRSRKRLRLDKRNKQKPSIS